MDVDEQVTMGSDGRGYGRPLQGPPVTTAARPATVSGGTLEAEVGVIAEQQWKAIRERRASGMSVSRIARELDLDRKTVRKALQRGQWQPYRRAVAAPRLLDEHRAWLVDRAAQVNYSARILY